MLWLSRSGCCNFVPNLITEIISAISVGYDWGYLLETPRLLSPTLSPWLLSEKAELSHARFHLNFFCNSGNRMTSSLSEETSRSIRLFRKISLKSVSKFVPESDQAVAGGTASTDFRLGLSLSSTDISKSSTWTILIFCACTVWPLNNRRGLSAIIILLWKMPFLIAMTKKTSKLGILWKCMK